MSNHKEKCDWDEITDIFQRAIDRKGLSKEEVKDMSDRILNEVRNEFTVLAKPIDRAFILNPEKAEEFRNQPRSEKLDEILEKAKLIGRK